VYLFNGTNLGYGAAHNIGIKKAIEEKVDYHVVINPD
ncbi:glycosyltransferase family 2 protein, partial [Bacteroides fragilis]